MNRDGFLKLRVFAGRQNLNSKAINYPCVPPRACWREDGGIACEALDAAIANAALEGLRPDEETAKVLEEALANITATPRQSCDEYQRGLHTFMRRSWTVIGTETRGQSQNCLT